MIAAATSALLAPLAVSSKAPRAPTPAQKGLAFASTHCAECHAIDKTRPSPNPEAPQFEEIARMPGLSQQTLSTFLHDSHNFPEKMDFTLEPGQADVLAAYILTLKSPD